ncbi:MAG: tetratricopeptide repeat protein [Sulfuricella sp.]
MKKYWIVALLLISMPAWAILPNAATPAERAMCEARGMPGGQGRYQGHFCDGLRFTDRAYASMGNKQEMRYYLEVSINNFDYVLGHTKEDDVMRGEAHAGKARALKLLGKKGEAAAEYIKALRYTPNSSAIYLVLADFYQETGDKPKALEMVTEGLRRNPDSKGLKRRYTELGGKLPYSETVTKAMPAEVAGAAPPSGETTSQAADASPEPIKFKTEGKAEPVPASAQTTPAEPVAAPKIGSPNNPYCRFCTD